MKIRTIPSLALLVAALSVGSLAQTGDDLYGRIKAFSLDGARIEVKAFALKHDRIEMTFSGTFYLPAAVDGRVTGAVFIGRGTFRAETPKSDFERANLKRFIGVEDAVESDFTTAYLRFSGQTASQLGPVKSLADIPQDARKLAFETEARVLKETGANLSSRITQAILNRDPQGVFFGMFDGGKRGRFSCLYDPEARLPTDYFDINGGEKGLIYKYDSATNNNDVWLAFYSLETYSSGRGVYSDMSDLINILHYEMEIDLTEPKKKLGLKMRMKVEPKFDGIRAFPFLIGESLGESGASRLRKQMRIKSARIDGKDVTFVQEDWEAAFTVFAGTEVKAKRAFDIEMDLEGDFLTQPESDISYPRSNSSWYPRHGYLDRATFAFRFHHGKNVKIACVGTRKSETPTEDGKMLTVYEMTQPIAFAAFASGPFKRHTEMIKWDKGGKPTPLEFNSFTHIEVAEPLMMAEMNNSVRYFHQLFGDYPYETYSATYHPYGFGQGFASMIFVPATNIANKNTFSFISHETAHQWWGNLVSWRSYRDQWLSEGFAEYSGVIYTNLRKNVATGNSLVNAMRDSLREPPLTQTGIGKGRLADVGPIILGHRLSSKRTIDGYQALVYNKGALVLRMLHYLFTDPQTGEGEPFYNMMRDFVGRYRNRTASTDDFRLVVNEHFAKTPLAAEFKMKDLDWFFRQWVYQAHLPSYKLEYNLEDQADGSCLVSGTVIQDDSPEHWFMPLPVVFKFGGDKVAQTNVVAYGPRRTFKLKLPSKPKSVELDPARWILSDKTSTR